MRRVTEATLNIVFGTIMIDAYRHTEARDVARALDYLCNSTDSWGWSSADVYCFWKYDDRELLYVDLARDLAERFKQHNGLVSHRSAGCKRDEVNAYFARQERLRFSVIAQSIREQPVGYPLARKIGWDFPYEDLAYLGLETTHHLEGAIIEGHRRVHGSHPPWNKCGGSIEGQDMISPSAPQLCDVLTGRMESFLRARVSLRPLAGDATETVLELQPIWGFR